MAKKTKSELVDDHGKLVYQSSQVEQSKQLKLKPVVAQLPKIEPLLSW